MTTTKFDDKHSLSPVTSSVNMIRSIQFTTPLKAISLESTHNKHSCTVTTVTPEASVANHDSVGDDFDLGFLYENNNPEDSDGENNLMDTFGNCKGAIDCFSLQQSGLISSMPDSGRQMKKRKYEYSSPVKSTALSKSILPSRPPRNRSSSDLVSSRNLFSCMDQNDKGLLILPPIIFRQDSLVPWKSKRRRLNMPMDNMLQNLSIGEQVVEK